MSLLLKAFSFFICFFPVALFSRPKEHEVSKGKKYIKKTEKKSIYHLAQAKATYAKSICYPNEGESSNTFRYTSSVGYNINGMKCFPILLYNGT